MSKKGIIIFVACGSSERLSWSLPILQDLFVSQQKGTREDFDPGSTILREVSRKRIFA